MLDDTAMRVMLSLRADYAVRAMLALGAMDRGAPISARRIAERTRIPARFVAHVMADLGRAELVRGARGRGGGYRLATTADRIDLLQIVDAVDGSDSLPRCVLRGGPCDVNGRCAVHDAFAGATAALRDRLHDATLAGLVDKAELGGGGRPIV
jgi:Rrf2 family iron-sulfur cluster assembly transcriptional regulator